MDDSSGVLGLVRAGRYPAEKARRGLAMAGIALGLLVSAVVSTITVIGVFVYISCIGSSAC